MTKDFRKSLGLLSAIIRVVHGTMVPFCTLGKVEKDMEQVYKYMRSYDLFKGLKIPKVSCFLCEPQDVYTEGYGKYCHYTIKYKQDVAYITSSLHKRHFDLGVRITQLDDFIQMPKAMNIAEGILLLNLFVAAQEIRCHDRISLALWKANHIGQNELHR